MVLLSLFRNSVTIKFMLTIEDVKEKIIPVLRSHGISKAGLFGSLVSGGFDEKSDIDVLIDFQKKGGLFAFIGIKQELETVLDREVDLVEYEALKPALRDSILKNQVSIL